MRRFLPLLAALVAGALLVNGQRIRTKKEPEPVTQTLELPPDPPAALTVETKRLAFVVAPLSAKGLLSQQVRDGIRALWRAAGPAPIVKIRAFVAGAGDLRRVQAIVSEMFAEKHAALPVLSVVQVGALPMTGAQVQMEAVTQDPRKIANPNGIAFISGQRDTDLEKSLARLRTALAETEPLRVACFLSSLDEAAKLAPAFPGVPVFAVQAQRAPLEPVVECEAVARLKSAESEPARLLNPAALGTSPYYSHIARIGAPRLVLAGAQIVFRYQEPDVRLAFERLEKTLTAQHASLKQTVMLNYYPLSEPLTGLVRKVRFDYLDAQRPPASTLMLFEGLPGLDASISLEVVAVPKP